MRYTEISSIREAIDYADYQAHGIDRQDADRFARYPLSGDDAAFYIKLGKGVDGAIQRLEQERVKGVLRRAETGAMEKLKAALPALHQSNAPVSYRAACALIADDDDLFDMVRGWTQNADYAEYEKPDVAARFLAVLKRIKPLVRKQLFRGQMPFAAHESDKRGFHSWSANRKTAEMFAERHGHIIEIDRPIQGVSLEDIVTWRMRLRDNESHYSGPQAEWFVVDQPEQFRAG
jgi:hypothetical protein